MPQSEPEKESVISSVSVPVSECLIGAILILKEVVFFFLIYSFEYTVRPWYPQGICSQTPCRSWKRKKMKSIGLARYDLWTQLNLIPGMCSEAHRGCLWHLSASNTPGGIERALLVFIKLASADLGKPFRHYQRTPLVSSSHGPWFGIHGPLSPWTDKTRSVCSFSLTHWFTHLTFV